MLVFSSSPTVTPISVQEPEPPLLPCVLSSGMDREEHGWQGGPMASGKGTLAGLWLELECLQHSLLGL